MTSEFIHGSARNSLVWLGVAKSTHRASERVRGSGRGRAWIARLGTTRPGMDSHTASVRGCGREAWHGAARRGKAQRGKHTAAYGPLQFARRCSALRGLALPGAAGRGKHTAAYGPLQFARQGMAGQGRARQGAAWRGKHTAAYGPLQFGAVWRGGAGLGKAGRGVANTSG